MASINPYLAPQSRVAAPDGGAEGFGQIKLLSLRGRLGRLRFFVFYTLIGLAAMLLMLALGWVMFVALAGGAYGAEAERLFGAGYMALIVIISLVSIPLGLVLSVQRLHDINASGWWALLALLPLLQLGLAAALLFVPGTPQANRFGLRPPPNTSAIKGLAWLAVGLFALLIAASVVLGLGGSFRYMF